MIVSVALVEKVDGDARVALDSIGGVAPRLPGAPASSTTALSVEPTSSS
jgi:hypothetical protein